MPVGLVKLDHFDIQKRRFFVRLGIQLRPAFKLHKSAGLWDRIDGKKIWRQVTEHCLVEAIRAKIIGMMIGLSKEMQEKLFFAGALHDYNKRQEMEELWKAKTQGRSPLQAVGEVDLNKLAGLSEAGFDPEVVELANAAGGNPDVMRKTSRLLKGTQKGEFELAYLIMHYVDDYTRGSEWVIPVETDGTGKKINDLHRRMQKNRSNPNYTRIREEIEGELIKDPELKKELGERDLFALMVELSSAIAQLFTLLIAKRQLTRIPWDPTMLPEIADDHVRYLILDKELTRITEPRTV